MVLRVLLLAVRPRWTLANTLRDHVRALRTLSLHDVTLLQNYLALLGPYRAIKTIPPSFPLENFDVLVVHYSNYMALTSHFDSTSISRIRAFRGLKVAFIQDEYRTVDATVERLREMDFDVLFTCVPEPEIEKVYPAAKLPKLRKITTLTGYVPTELTHMRVPPIASRPIDVGYRARVVPYWLGDLGAEKWQIALKFAQRANGSGLKLDLAPTEQERLYGKRWTRFLTSCKTALGVESGASVFDFTGEIQKTVSAYVALHPEATFEQVRDLFLLPHEGKVRLNQISPRAFEAAALRTPMVLYEGGYSGILRAGDHYIELNKDFSNIEDVIAQVKDVAHLSALAERTYREVALNPEYSYETFVKTFDRVLEEEVRRRGTEQPSQRISKLGKRTRVARIALAAAWSRIRIALSWGSAVVYILIPLWSRIPSKARDVLRPMVRAALKLKR
jgi:hypothetical protein